MLLSEDSTIVNKERALKGKHCLQLSDGRVTSVVGEMQEQTVEFYTELHRAELCYPVCAQVLFK